MNQRFLRHPKCFCGGSRFRSGVLLDRVLPGLALLLLSSFSSPVSAQNPFAPAGGQPAADPAPADPAPADDAEAAPALETDPTVLALRELNPSTALELTRAVQAMLNYQRPDEAQRYLEKLAAADPDAATLVEMHTQFGTGLFLKWLRSDELGSEAGELARKVLAAAEQAAHDPAVLDRAVQQLADPSPAVRGPALARLRAANEAGVVALLKATAAGVSAEHQAAIRQALRYLGSVTEEPLLAALQADDERLQTEAALLLGRRQESRAVKYLLAPYRTAETESLENAAAAALLRIVGEVPSASAAETYLKRRIDDYLRGMLPGQIDLDGLIGIWTWDDAAGMPVLVRKSPPLASAQVAQRLAEDLLRLQPEDPVVQRLHLLTALKAAKLSAGVDTPLPGGEGTIRHMAIQRPANVLNAVLQEAIDTDQLVAATAAAETLGDILLPHQLVAADGRPVPLVAALDHPDRRLRFAALQALMQIDPQIPYAGSSKVTDALIYFSRSGGVRRVLIGHPRIAYARTLAALFEQAGYTADLARSGEQFYDLAKWGPDYEFGLIADSLQDPYMDKLLSMLRHDPRTQQLPLTILARHGNLEQARRFAERDERTLALPRLYDLEGIALAVSEMNRLSPQPPLTETVRAEQALEATGWLVALAEPLRGHPIYNILQREDVLAETLAMPTVALVVTKALGKLATPRSQLRLADVASDYGRPLAIRQAAAAAFAEAVQRRGILLSREAVLLQYDRYNQSEQLDEPTQKLLGDILDAIESRWPPGADLTP